MDSEHLQQQNEFDEPQQQSEFDEPQPQSKSEPQQQQVRLVDITVETRPQAFQMLIKFLNLANTRGAFGMEESHKLWECVKMFKE